MPMAGGRKESERGVGRRIVPTSSRKAIALRTRRRVLRNMSIVAGLALCALLGSTAVAFLRALFGLFGPDQSTRYAGYITEPQAPLAVPLQAIPWVEVHLADQAPAEPWIGYTGFSHLICPSLLAVVVVPTAAHCRALCTANGPPCVAFTFTPAARCYLAVESSGNESTFKGWPSEATPGMVSGTVSGHGSTDYSDSSQVSQSRIPTNLCDTGELPPLPLRPLDVAGFAATLAKEDSSKHLLRSPEGRLFSTARARLEQETVVASVSHRASTPKTGPQQRFLLSVGIDCCKRSKMLQALTGLAFGGFDAVIQPGREHYGQNFAATYAELVHEHRGAGYWVWKPYFLLRTLLELAHDDDLVWYGDAGTYFHVDSLAHRQAELDFLYNRSTTAKGNFRQDVLVYAEGSPEWQRTKRDLVDAALVGLSDDGNLHGSNATKQARDRRGGDSTSERDAILRSPQVSATWVIVRRSPQSIAFVNDWLSACLGTPTLVPASAMQCLLIDFCT